MLPLSISKFGFRIRTRNGAVVDNLLINGRDEEEARQKLRQMYRDCEVLETRQVVNNTKPQNPSFEDVVDLLSGS